MANDSQLVYQYVNNRIARLSQTDNESAVRAVFAKLRRGIGHPPGGDPYLWEITIADLPEPLLSKGRQASRGEWAVHTALTLYALHQQGKNLKTEPMHVHGLSLGTSVRRLVASDTTRAEAILRRFISVSASSDFDRLVWQLRGTIQLLKNKSIPLDYALLSSDLYWFQLPSRRDSIRLQWGQDFYRRTATSSPDNSDKKGVN